MIRQSIGRLLVSKPGKLNFSSVLLSSLGIGNICKINVEQRSKRPWDHIREISSYEAH